MKQIKIAVLMSAFFCIFAYFGYASAHSADISYAEAYLNIDDQNEPIGRNEIRVNYFISWTQASLLFEEYRSRQGLAKEELKSGARILSEYIQKIRTSEAPFASYLNDHIKIYNDGEKCAGSVYALDTRQTEDDILLGKGLRLSATYSCSVPIERIKIENDYFIDIFPYQNNQFYFYRGPEGFFKRIDFNKDNTSSEISLVSEDIKDNNFIAKLLPNYSLRDFSPKNLTEKLTKNYFNKPKIGPLVSLIILFILGFLHTFEAGHSKMILASLIIDKKIKLIDSVSYSAVFALTHIVDILILGLAFLFINKLVNLYDKLPFIQSFSLYGLVFFSGYLLLRSLRNMVLGKNESHSHGHIHSHDHGHLHIHSNNKPPRLLEQIGIGFLVGLAPCLFGWSIFLMLVSLESMAFILVQILSFGAGVFSALVLFSFIITKAKERIWKRFEKFSPYSPVISYALLFSFALAMVII